jgi:predicted GIY-YIG superfamily endonuclease
MKRDKIFGVYFLTDRHRKRSYCGYSNDIKTRYETHSKRLAASAKTTKSFDECHLWVQIEGFPTCNKALSFEWFAKRHKLKIHAKALKLHDSAPHKRVATFLAPLLHDKFRACCKHLTVYTHDPTGQWSDTIAAHYGVTVKAMVPPFHPTHVTPKRVYTRRKTRTPRGRGR